jgi:hypothetical protein
MLPERSLPVIDVAALLGAASMARRTDAAIMSAAAATGFFLARGFGAEIPLDRASRSELLRVFSAARIGHPAALAPQVRRLARQRLSRLFPLAERIPHGEASNPRAWSRRESRVARESRARGRRKA